LSVATTVQGDQIGRIFAYWAIVFFGQFFYYRSSPYFRYFFLTIDRVLFILTRKYWLGYILGDFPPTRLVTLLLSEKRKHFLSIFLQFEEAFIIIIHLKVANNRKLSFKNCLTLKKLQCNQGIEELDL
jgi:hypothetical protein